MLKNSSLAARKYNVQFMRAAVELSKEAAAELNHDDFEDFLTSIYLLAKAFNQRYALPEMTTARFLTETEDILHRQELRIQKEENDGKTDFSKSAEATE